MVDTARRFVFHGHACAYSGRLYRPEHLVIPSPASAAVSVAGGLSESTSATRKRWGGYLSVGASTAIASAGFDDKKQAVAMSHGKVGEETLASTTTASAEINGIVADDKRIQIEQVSVSLVATPSRDGGQSSIRIGRKSAIRGVTIDGHTLQVTLDLKRFDEEATFDACARSSQGKALVYAAHKDLIHTTLVTGLAWRGKPHPTAVIEDNSVYVEGLGRIYFGEIFIERAARRVTMLRLHLGSPIALRVGFGDVGTNGSWYPPT